MPFAGLKAKAATTMPGNQYVSVTNWQGQVNQGIASSATVTPVAATVTMTKAMLLVKGSGGGFFNALNAGQGEAVVGVGSGSGNFTALLMAR